MRMEMFMRVIGLMTKLMAMECIRTWMEQNTKGTGKKISNMEKVKKHGLMVLFMKVII